MRYSGRTAMNANISVSEHKPPEDFDSPLAFSMEGLAENPPSSLVPFYWTPGWNSVQALYNYLDEPNGSMKGGDPGIRLFEPGKKRENIYFKQEKEIIEKKNDEWQIVPVFQIFGSEELSSVGTAISQRIKKPFVLMNQKDADILKIKSGDLVELEIGKIKLSVEAKIDKGVLEGLAGLSVNLPGMPFIGMSCYGKFHKL